jgi:hypothetical protein
VEGVAQCLCACNSRASMPLFAMDSVLLPPGEVFDRFPSVCEAYVCSGRRSAERAGRPDHGGVGEQACRGELRRQGPWGAAGPLAGESSPVEAGDPLNLLAGKRTNHPRIGHLTWVAQHA